LYVPRILAAIDRSGRLGGWTKMRSVVSLFKKRPRASEIFMRLAPAFHAMFAEIGCYRSDRHQSHQVHAARISSCRIMICAGWHHDRTHGEIDHHSVKAFVRRRPIIASKVGHDDNRPASHQRHHRGNRAGRRDARRVADSTGPISTLKQNSVPQTTMNLREQKHVVV
jgi:hypothetical protein